MFDLDHWYEIFVTLRRNPLRTALTAVGVFWGVFMLLMLVGFGNGLEGGVRGGMSGMATNSIYIWGERTSVPHDGLTPGRIVRLTLADAEALRQEPGVEAVAPRIELGGRRAAAPVTRGQKSGSFTVAGDLPDYIRIQPMVIEVGRFINRLDISQRRKVAVIGTQVRRELFEKDEEVVGQTIRVRGIDFRVVGVFDTTQTGDQAERHTSTIYLPLTTFQQTLTSSPYVHYMAVLVDPDGDASEVEDALVLRLKERHRVAPKDEQAVGSFNAEVEFGKVTGLFTGINLLVWFVGGMTLLAGVIGVSNIMMISVKERTREIGVRKAIGATPRAVISQIVLESTVLTAGAGYLGLLAAVGLLELIGKAMEGGPSGGSGGGGAASMFAAPTVEFNVAFAATIVVAIGGALAGLFPALHAASIRTVTALRDE